MARDGQIQDKIWARYGQDVGKIRARDVRELCERWARDGQKWAKYGQDNYEQDMGQRDEPDSLDCQRWARDGQEMGKIWARYGQELGKRWAKDGQNIGNSWEEMGKRGAKMGQR